MAENDYYRQAGQYFKDRLEKKRPLIHRQGFLYIQVTAEDQPELTFKDLGGIETVDHGWNGPKDHIVYFN